MKNNFLVSAKILFINKNKGVIIKTNNTSINTVSNTATQINSTDANEKSNFLMYKIIALGILILIIAMGVRQSFGVFLPSLSQAFDISRSSFGLALAIQHLIFGIFQPFVGYLSDKYGAHKVLSIGGFIYTLGLYLVTQISDSFGLFISLGFLIGLALSATTYVVILGAIAKVVSAKRRSTVFGIATAAGSFGMFVFIPISQNLLVNFELNEVFYFFCLVTLVMMVSGFFMKVSTKNDAAIHEEEISLQHALKVCKTHWGYWRLNIGFFVCGFHVAFVATHFPTYLLDEGITAGAATLAFSFIGLFNIIGSFSFGVLGDKYSKRKLLTILYFLRGIVFSLMLILPFNETTALLFGALIGLLWLATVPLTSGMVVQIFGIKALATLYGIVFLFHQLGSFLGAWMGGIVYDYTGSYDSIWWACVGLSILAAVIHIGMDDKKIKE